jgi:hypothetical protein
VLLLLSLSLSLFLFLRLAHRLIHRCTVGSEWQTARASYRDGSKKHHLIGPSTILCLLMLEHQCPM